MPPLSPEEYQALKEDIRRNGVLVPVEKDERGNILDGHHRDRAWQELKTQGVKLKDYPVIIRPGLTEAEKRCHARRLNLARRHLTRQQRRQLVADQLREAPALSNRATGAALGCDHKTVASVRAGLESGGEIPHLEEATGADGKSYPARRPVVFAKDDKETKRAQAALQAMPAEELPEHIMDVKRVERLTREHMIRTRIPVHTGPTAGADLRVGDMRQALKDVHDDSVSLIFTDPPYDLPSLPLYGDLAQMAARILEPGGSLLCYCGNYALPEILRLMTPHLRYWWCCACVHGGGRRWLCGKNVFVGWKAILWFVKERRGHDEPIADTVSSGREKDRHEWQQGLGEALYYVEHLAPKEALVVDPFLGSGTTAVAAVRLGRRFVGCDINPGAVATSQERLANGQKQDTGT
jgi:site-specific DNA-methyltransferase (adenine-specific)